MHTVNVHCKLDMGNFINLIRVMKKLSDGLSESTLKEFVNQNLYKLSDVLIERYPGQASKFLKPTKKYAKIKNYWFKERKYVPINDKYEALVQNSSRSRGFLTNNLFEALNARTGEDHALVSSIQSNKRYSTIRIFFNTKLFQKKRWNYAELIADRMKLMEIPKKDIYPIVQNFKLAIKKILAKAKEKEVATEAVIEAAFHSTR